MALRRNQKIGIAAAGGATAVGVTAAILYARRRPKCDAGMAFIEATGRCEPLVLVGIPGGETPDADPLTQARRRFCNYPQALTVEQRELLMDAVFVPLAEAAGGVSWNGPQEVDEGVAAVSADGLRQLCAGVTRPRTRELSLALARGAYWRVTGQTGQ